MAGLGLAGLCLLPVIFLGVLAVLSWRPPALGVVDGQLTPCPNRPNCVSTQATDPEHRMEPIPFSGTAEEMRNQLRVALQEFPSITIISEGTPPGYVRAEAVSSLFRFVDDVEFLLDEEQRQLHFRSGSRVGHSDLGANRKRMTAVRETLLKQSSNE